MLKRRLDSRGYPHILMHTDTGSHSRLVHRLVAEAFIGPPPTAEHEVNHKNGTRADNRVENLEYLTPSENVRHGLDVLGKKRARGEMNSQAKLTESAVQEIRLRRADGESRIALARALGVSRHTISRVDKRIYWGWLP